MSKVKLRNLRVWKVDLCGAGANPDADIVIFKSKILPEDQPVIKRNIPASERHKMPRADFAGGHESFPIEQPEDVESAGHLVGHSPNPAATRARIIRIARRKGPEFVARLPKSWNVSKEDTSVKKPNKIDITKATPEELSAYALELEKSLEEQELELAKAAKKGKKPTPPTTDDNDADDAPVEKDDTMVEMAKSIDVMKSTIDALRKELDVAKSTATTAQQEVKKANDAAELVTIEKMVEKDMHGIPGSTTDLAKMLQQAKATLTTESYEVLTKALKAGSEAIAKATTEVGSSSKAVGSAEQEIFKRADDMVKAGTHKTRPEAISAITKADPELAERYKIEKSAARK